MTLINCKINDSGSVPLTGFIRVTADYLISDDLTKVATVPASRRVPLVNGQCQLNLEDSDIARVSYRFDVWQVKADVSGIVWSFNARVPASIDPINFTDLLPTGITRDALDTGLLAVSRRMLADDTFWSRLKSDILRFKGVYNATTYYRKGDAVVYQGSSYVMIFDGIVQNQIPFNNATYWLLFAARGEQPTAVTGDNESYNETTWANNFNAPTKNAVMQRMKQLAVQDGAILANVRIANTWANTDYSQNVAYTSWVVDKVNAMRGLASADSQTIANAAIVTANNYTDTTNNSQNVDIAAKYNDSIDRLPVAFYDRTILVSGLTPFNGNVWTDVVTLPITVKPRGSACVAIDAFSLFDQATGNNAALRLRLMLNGSYSNEYYVYAFNNVRNTQLLRHMFRNIGGGSYIARLQVVSDVNMSWTIRDLNMSAIVF